jgi:pyridoxamine 5'-phosphate oxidase
MHAPLTKFSLWLADAQNHPAIAEPTAMTLATATADGLPSARIVLLKAHGPEGLTFYTNFTSRKSAEIKANPHVALVFYWMPLDRQVRIEGSVSEVSAAEADAYFRSRPRARQIGAWASLQSQPMQSRSDLETRNAEIEQRYEGQEVPRPPHWSGWRVRPKSFEFWIQNAARLHEREIYTLDGANWQHSLLYP